MKKVIASTLTDNNRDQIIGYNVEITNVRKNVGQAIVNGRAVQVFRKQGSKHDWVTYMCSPFQAFVNKASRRRFLRSIIEGKN